MSDTPAPATDIMALLRTPPVPDAATETAAQPVLPVEVALAPLMAPAAAGEAPQAISATAEAPALPALVARIVSDKPRAATYVMLWPVEYAGKLYTSIIRSRPSSKDVGDYFERLIAQKEGDLELRFPIFFDDAGALVPEPVWDAMDDDDRTALLTGLDDFLPLRLQRLRASSPDVSTPAAGEDTGPTS